MLHEGTHIQIVIHFLPISSLASCNEHQFTLQVTEFIEVVGHLSELLVSWDQLDSDEVMDAVCQPGLTGHANLVDAISENVPHLSIRGDLH